VKNLVWVILALSALAGYFSVYPLIIPVLAMISTVLLMSERRRQAKTQNVSGAVNLFADGAYLLAIQCLIMFIAFILGLFFANRIVVA